MKKNSTGQANPPMNIVYQHNQLVLDTLPEGIYGIDDAGIITYINRAAQEALGWPEKDALGQRAHDLFHHHRADGSAYAVNECPILLAQGGVDDIREMADVFWRRDGTPLQVELSVTTMPASSLGTRKLVVFHDVSQLKENQKTLLQTVSELATLNAQINHAHNAQLQTEKMQAVGQMAAGVAHEINNPIGFVHSNLGSLEKYIQSMLALIEAYEALEDKGVIVNDDLAGISDLKRVMDFAYLRDDLADLLSESCKGVDRVRKIVQSLKEFSREGSQAEWGWMDLPTCIENVLCMIQGELEQKCCLKKDYGKTPEVYCVPAQISQVLMNILVNAVQSIDARGEISIRSGTDEKTVWVEITDTGSGIAPENLPRIFDPFFTTKPVGHGAGMGLALAYGIVRQHGGWIDVTSTPGQGSAFLVVLPIRPVPAM